MTDETAPAGSSLLRLAAGFYAIVAVFAFGYAIFDGLQADEARPAGEAFLGLAIPSLGLALAGIGVGLVIVGVVHVGMRAVPGVDRAASEFAALVGPLTAKEAWLLALMSGVAEELLFRGALFPHLGMWGTTFLFGLVHVIPRRSLWAYPLFAAGAGLMLGILRDASGSVLPPILAHVTVNGLNLWWLGKHHGRLVGDAPKPAATSASAPAATGLEKTDPPKGDDA